MLSAVDASALQTGEPSQLAVFRTQLIDSLVSHGFIRLINHGIPEHQIDEVFEQSKHLFQLPWESKNKLSNDPEKSDYQRGWSALGDEQTWALFGQEGVFGSKESSDSKENFDFGSPREARFPNKWPSKEDLPGFQAKMEAFYRTCHRVSQQVLKELALALNLPPGTFAEQCSKNEASTMRINHFPEVHVREVDAGQTCRIWPHFDFGIISLVFRDVVGGLELEDRAQPGTFVPVPCASHTEMCVNIGEQFQRWSNGRIRAGLHRVTKPYRRAELVDGEMLPERFSVAFFVKADHDASVGPIARFVTPEFPQAYEDITASEFQRRRNKATYYSSKQTAAVEAAA